MLRISTVFTGPPGSPFYSTFYFGGTTPGEADAAATAVNDFWEDLEGVMRNDMAWATDGTAEFVNPANGQVTGIETVPTSGGSGTDAANKLPATTQGLLRLRTGVYNAGREIRGRCFMPGPTEAHSSAAGLPEAAYIGVIETAAAALITAAGGAGDWSIWSRTHGAVAPVTTATMWTEWATLRSRRD